MIITMVGGALAAAELNPVSIAAKAPPTFS